MSNPFSFITCRVCGKKKGVSKLSRKYFPTRARTACAWCVVGSLQVSTGDENIIHSLEALMLDVVDDAYYDDAEISKLRILKLFQ